MTDFPPLPYSSTTPLSTLSFVYLKLRNQYKGWTETFNRSFKVKETGRKTGDHFPELIKGCRDLNFTKHVEIECCLQQRMKTFRFREVTFRYLIAIFTWEMKSPFFLTTLRETNRLFHVRFPRVISANTVRKYKFLQPLIKV